MVFYRTRWKVNIMHFTTQRSATAFSHHPFLAVRLRVRLSSDEDIEDEVHTYIETSSYGAV